MSSSTTRERCPADGYQPGRLESIVERDKAKAEWHKAKAKWDKVDTEWDKAKAKWDKVDTEWDKARAKWHKADTKLKFWVAQAEAGQ